MIIILYVIQQQSGSEQEVHVPQEGVSDVFFIHCQTQFGNPK
jgi:hypothetical protein